MTQGMPPVQQDMRVLHSLLSGEVEDNGLDVRKITDKAANGFDVRAQVSARPWAAFGIAMLAGYALGSLGDSDDGRNEKRQAKAFITATQRSGEQGNRPNDGGLLSQIGDELETVKMATIDSVVTTIRGFMSNTLPEFDAAYEQTRAAQGLSKAPDGLINSL